MIRVDSSAIQPTLKLLKYFFGNICVSANTSYCGTPCWDWTTIPSKGGYGRFKAQGIIGYAHVVACRMFDGAIPEELSCDHLCKRPICASPAHIKYVSLKINILRSETHPATINADKTRCIYGHEFTPQNTYSLNGHRWCRLCRADIGFRFRRRQGMPLRIKGLCRKGHELSPENSIIKSDGKRMCRTCKNARDRTRRQKKRGTHNIT